MEETWGVRQYLCTSPLPVTRPSPSLSPMFASSSWVMLSIQRYCQIRVNRLGHMRIFKRRTSAMGEAISHGIFTHRCSYAFLADSSEFLPSLSLLRLRPSCVPFPIQQASWDVRRLQPNLDQSIIQTQIQTKIQTQIPSCWNTDTNEDRVLRGAKLRH